MVRDSYGSSSCGAMRPPAWLGGLVGETFFVACGAHENRKKNEKNIFCLECCRSICPHCSATSSHRHHPLLQAYTINSAKVVFLKQRPQSRPFKGSGNICLTCDRILQEPFHFCSLFCKVDHVMMQGQDLSGILHRFNESDISFSGFFDGLEDEGRITPNSILENPLLDCSGSGNGNGNGNGGNGSHGSHGSSVEDSNNKKNKSKKENKCSSSNSSGAGFLVLSLSNRRKGAAPQRAPLS